MKSRLALPRSVAECQPLLRVAQLQRHVQHHFIDVPLVLKVRSHCWVLLFRLVYPLRLTRLGPL